jgi:hypothetical protein
LWGATDETLIHSIRSSQYIEIAISSVPLPGLFFEAGMSFEVFETLILTRDEFLCNREPLRPSHHGSKRWTFEELARLPPARPHQYITMSDISGPLTHAVLWGDCVT